MHTYRSQSVRVAVTACRLSLLFSAAVIAFMPLMPSALAAYCAIAAYLAWPVLILCLAEAVILRKKPFWCIAFLLAVVVSLTWVRHFLPFRQTARQAPEAISLRLVSCNVDNFGLHYQDYDNLRHQAALIRSYRPDIICLQERPHTNVISFDSIRQAFSTYPYYCVNTREDEVLNLVVFSRYPLSSLTEYYFPGSYNKALAVSIAVGEDSLRLYNVHLQTTGVSTQAGSAHRRLAAMIRNEKARNLQSDQLLSVIARSRQPVIVTGDFNASRTSRAYRRFAAVLSDCSQSSPGLHGTWQPLGPWLKIDHTLCSPQFHTHSYAVADNPWSDHRLQVVSLHLQKTCKQPGHRK